MKAILRAFALAVAASVLGGLVGYALVLWPFAMIELTLVAALLGLAAAFAAARFVRSAETMLAAWVFIAAFGGALLHAEYYNYQHNGAYHDTFRDDPESAAIIESAGGIPYAALAVFGIPFFFLPVALAWSLGRWRSGAFVRREWARLAAAAGVGFAAFFAGLVLGALPEFREALKWPVVGFALAAGPVAALLLGRRRAVTELILATTTLLLAFTWLFLWTEHIISSAGQAFSTDGRLVAGDRSLFDRIGHWAFLWGSLVVAGVALPVTAWIHRRVAARSPTAPAP